jgi:histidinol-phosphate/aromatic aminotransferase/cobyric acid decarboxylase-like protein
MFGPHFQYASVSPQKRIFKMRNIVVFNSIDILLQILCTFCHPKKIKKVVFAPRSLPSHAAALHFARAAVRTKPAAAAAVPRQFRGKLEL